MHVINFSKIIANLPLSLPPLLLAKSEMQEREAMNIGFWSIIPIPSVMISQNLSK